MEQKEQIGTGLEIAVIGMAGRFPGAKDIHEFWDNIKNSVESIRFFTDEELIGVGVSPQLLENPNYVKANGILDDFDYFDATFFGYTPKEAEIMDPQIRIFHECAWGALEDAGVAPGTYDGLIGLYAGATPNLHWQARALLSGKSSEIGEFAANQLSQKDYITLRISYKLDLKGPSFVLYTTCSTSLVAIHIACQAILNGECDMALAGGITVINLNKTGYMYQEGMVASPDGHCRAFDAKAKGVVGGDGVGVVVLKRLEDAVADRNHIYAVVKGSAVNNDGVRRAGFTAPSVAGQAEVIKMAMQVAEVEPESIRYVETHGTATALGDPVEIEGLKLAFNTREKGFCGIGSVKTNVGHLDSAAGVTGFIKTVLALKHKLLPPTLHFESPNPGIDFIDSPFYINTKLTPWENGEYPLRAGVSAFGIGGTNAHVILEAWGEGEAQGATDEEKAGAFRLIVLSARTSTALDKMTENLADYFKEYPGMHLADAAYTLQVGRPPFKYRKMCVCSSIEQASALLSGVGPGKIYSGVIEEENLENPIGEAWAGDPELHGLLEKIGFSWLQGATVDWSKLYPGEERSRIPLPTYPFEGRRYWIDEAHLKLTTPGDRDAYKAASPTVTLYPRPELGNAYIAPANETEKKLAGIWQNFFGFDQIGAQDDFFELGGDSLTVISMVSRIQKEMEILVPIPEFFNRSTICQLGEYIRLNPRKDTYIEVEPVEEKEYYALSPAQERLYVVQQVDEGSTSYNMYKLVELGGEIHRQRFEATFRELILRHESLRTSFEMIGHEPVQRLHKTVTFTVEFHDLSGGANKQGKVVKQVVGDFIKPFNLSCAPLFRAGLVKISDTRYLLLVDMHHIITDGFSMEIMVTDFLAIYAQKKLVPLTLQYKDYSEWLNSREVQLTVKQQEEYWLNEFKEEIPQLDIPCDFVRPEVQTFEGDLEQFILDAHKTGRLKVLADNGNSTLFMVLLAIYNVLLSKLGGQEDIIVGIGSHGRRHEELRQIIGIFVNTLALRNYPLREKTFMEFLGEVREKTLLAFENQDYPFEKLVEKAVPYRQRNRNPLFDTVFVSLNMERTPTATPETEISKLNTKPYEYKTYVSKFDISLLVREVQNSLIFTLEYVTRLFKQETIKRFIFYFNEIISAVLDNNQIKLGDITISHQLLSVPVNNPNMELEFENK